MHPVRILDDEDPAPPLHRPEGHGGHQLPHGLHLDEGALRRHPDQIGVVAALYLSARQAGSAGLVRPPVAEEGRGEDPGHGLFSYPLAPVKEIGVGQAAAAGRRPEEGLLPVVTVNLPEGHRLLVRLPSRR